jgi:probable phosphoglycerate mutase
MDRGRDGTNDVGMPRIYLTRHGQDEDNARGILNGRRDLPLTDMGIAQAEEAARRIRDSEIRFGKIYSSPLRRAYSTAQIIADALEMSLPVVLPDLIERDFGVMTGQPLCNIEARCSPDILKTDTVTYFLKSKGAETYPQLIERAARVLEDLDGRHADDDMLLVTHGDFGKMLYAAYYRLDWVDVLKMFHFGNSELLELSEHSNPEDARIFKIPQHNA